MKYTKKAKKWKSIRIDEPTYKTIKMIAKSKHESLSIVIQRLAEGNWF